MSPLSLAAFPRVLALPALLLVAGCAVATPVAISASRGPAPGLARLAVMPVEAGQAEKADFAARLVEALGKRGVAAADDAPVLADLALASAPADVDLLLQTSAEAGASPGPLGTARASRWYDRCAARRTRASLALYDRASGALIAKSDAETVTCAADPAPLAALADAVVADAIGAPPPR